VSAAKPAWLHFCGNLPDMKRIPSRELLDDDNGTPAEVSDSFADLHFFNHCFGGVGTTAHMVERAAEVSGKSNLSVLEVAAGSGDLPQSVRQRLQRRGIDLQLTLLDRCSSHLTNGEAKVVGDALALPFHNDSFDLISCCLFVHHLAPEQVTAFAKEALRCARVAVLINDLVRNPVHLALVYAGLPIYRSRITRNDAPASVRQAYTPPEMVEMLRPAGAAGVEITQHYLYRMGVVLWKTGAPTKGRKPVNV
jgi:ubiquinone/menaquinone biosynthesis C-methylase UbiE